MPTPYSRKRHHHTVGSLPTWVIQTAGYRLCAVFCVALSTIEMREEHTRRVLGE